MQKTLRLSFALLITFAVGTLPCVAHAKTQKIKIEDGLLGIFKRGQFDIKLFHDPSKPENEFVMRLFAPGEVTGCAKMSKAEVTKKGMGQKIKLHVIDPEISLKTDVVRYGNYECQPSRNTVSIDIPMDRDELLKKKVNKISLDSEKYGSFDDADIEVSKAKIDIFTPGPDGKPERKYTLWFMPKNTIILNAPRAKSGSDVTGIIRNMARPLGLIPLEDALEGYEVSPNLKDSVYFVDPSQQIRKKLNTPNDSTNVGTITPTQTINGPNGPYEKPYTIDVIARLPGQTN